MISFSQRGSFSNIESFLRSPAKRNADHILKQAGEDGVAALSRATPIETGETARSWRYEVTRYRGGVKVTWYNDAEHADFQKAIAIQYGHGTGTGGYVQGRDYINPAMRPIFDRISDEIRKVVTG